MAFSPQNLLVGQVLVWYFPYFLKEKPKGGDI